MDEVLITGLGVASPLGDSVVQFWDALCHDISRPSVLHWQGGVMANSLRYSLKDQEGDASGGPAAAAFSSGRAARVACRVALRALADAGLAGSGGPRVGVAVGSAMGEVEEWEQHQLEGGPPEGANPFVFRVGAELAAVLGLYGPNLSCANACAASAYAVALGAEAILDGRADVMLVGGVDIASRLAMGCFNRLGALDSEACRPFDANRQGTILSEGVAFLVLESGRHARARGAERVYARVAGSGWSCDGHHATTPEASGAATERALRQALAEAGVLPEQIGCVVAHGTGTVFNDLRESELLARVFGVCRGDMPVTSPKGKLGHSGGAAGAFSCLIGALILATGEVPPIGNLAEADPACEVSLVQGQPRAHRPSHLLVSAYGFGGNNISLVLGGAHG